MPRGEFIGGDWGTSRLRLYLCDEALEIIDVQVGPGAAAARGHYETMLDSLIANWAGASSGIPVVLCGMVGSSIGWVETPYANCPVHPDALAKACVPLKNGRVHVVPGLACRNRFEAPDVMRGEETQVLGALLRLPELGSGQRLLCLPGTHTKWVMLSDGTITDFLTAPVGELYDVLSRHSILVSDAGASRMNEPAFAAGVDRVINRPEAGLLHLLFECRSRRVADEMPAEDSASFLSGLLVGSDASSALRAFGTDRWSGPVCIIGAPEITGLYSAALHAIGCAAEAIDGDSASLAGLGYLHRRLAQRGPVRAAS